MPLPETLSSDSSDSSDSLSTNSKLANAPVKVGWLRYAAPLLLLTLVLGLLYRDGIVWLLEIWSHNDYSHGYLVPLISLYIVWEQRERFRLLPIAPAYLAAAAVILVCLLLLIISRASAFIQFEAASLFLIIPGVLFLLFGVQITRAALLPWLYLSFSLPWFDLFLGHLQPPFQRISAIIGTKLLGLFFPVFLDGVYIQLPSIHMEVARECSGVNFFISVLAIGIPLVYLTQRRWTRALLVLGLGLLITVLANGLRVAIAGILGENFGPELLHGPAHIFQGWFVAWFGWVGLFLVNWYVVKRSDATKPKLFERWKFRLSSTRQKEQIARISSRLIYVTSAILALCGTVVYFASPRPVPLSQPLASLPTTLANWRGTEVEWLDQNTFFPGADEQLERIYYSSQNDTPIYLYIAYFNKQTEQKRLIRKFSQPLHKKAVTLNLPSSEPGISPRRVNRTFLIQGGIPYDIFFWYQFPDDKTATGQNQARVAALNNGIMHRQNNGAAVLVAIRQNPVRDTGKPTAVPQSISVFLKEVGSGIPGLLP